MFIFGGMIVGVIVTFIAVSLAPGRNDDGTPFLQAFGYFVIYGLAIGACVGALVAILIDAVLTRRAKNVETQRTATPAADEAEYGYEGGVADVQPEVAPAAEAEPRPQPDEGDPSSRPVAYFCTRARCSRGFERPRASDSLR
ncbi:hypothetical protein AX769_01970 [Frondihabitans sp. PAMC 28766]|uniref:hypothetical protein n=1 Tax=Frondihabitans sp. PAMC 28766 TaxID=1795630 RepID=UPI00078B7ACA|nr:hypothetical protein [Frondihabitans sp. PAMC 28766]AMM19125.1 hypothetical protein AX769_01970 [Frondihabitans sp. PAMC 28766]